MTPDLNTIFSRAERTYSAIRDEADGAPLPQDIREHFNYGVPALIGEIERLQVELAQARAEHSQVFDALEREKDRNPARTSRAANR
jgi:hypothetical protein